MVPFPVPLAPDVIVSQGALLVAVQAGHVALRVKVAVPLPPVNGSVAGDVLMLGVQMPPCVIVTV